MNYSNNNFNEVLKRVMKYFLEGLAVSFAAFWIPRRRMDVEDIIVIAITAATTFAVLVMWAPSTVAGAARWGAGFGIGTSLGAGGAGPIFPAENFINGLSTGATEPVPVAAAEAAAEAEAPAAAATTTIPVATGTDPSAVATWENIDSTAAEAPHLGPPPQAGDAPPSNSELLSHVKATPAASQEVIQTADGPPLPPTEPADHYPVPDAFSRNIGIVPNKFTCQWKANPKMIYNNKPEGYIGTCISDEGAFKLLQQS